MGSCLKIYCRIKAKMELCGDRQKSVAEEKLKFYITSCLFCLCNSACSLKILDHVGYAVLESGGLHQYLELELISLTLVLLFAVAQPLQSYLIMPVLVKVRHPLPCLNRYYSSCKDP